MTVIGTGTMHLTVWKYSKILFSPIRYGMKDEGLNGRKMFEPKKKNKNKKNA
jgi:hypothetical protein